jgi:DNA-binding FadR family transcriptional regulator
LARSAIHAGGTTGIRSLKRRGLVELASSQLSDQIAQGTWPVGTALPGEVALAEQLGVGRSTVREATRSLVQLGMLESRQGSGTYVLSLVPHPSLNAALHAAEVVEVYEVREALEVQAAALAARRRTEDDLAVIAAALDTRDRLSTSQTDDAEGFVTVDLAFHRAVVEAAHNALLLQMFETFLPVLSSTLVSLVDHGTFEGHDLDTSHADLLAAIRAGDAVAATAAVRSNVNDTIEIVGDR